MTGSQREEGGDGVSGRVDATAVSVLYVPGQDEQGTIVRDLSRRYLGRELADADYAALAAAQPGDRVRVWAHLVYPVHIVIWLDGHTGISPRLPLGARGTEYTSVLGIARDEGGPSINLQYIEVVNPQARGQGTGAWVVARLAMAAHAFGIGRVTAYADREHGRDGYYALPRMGFDRGFSAAERSRLPGSLAGVSRLADLMASAPGRAWWREHGWPVSVALDTAPRSREMTALRAYFAEKGWAWPVAPVSVPVTRVGAQSPSHARDASVGMHAPVVGDVAHAPGWQGWQAMAAHMR